VREHLGERRLPRAIGAAAHERRGVEELVADDVERGGDLGARERLAPRAGERAVEERQRRDREDDDARGGERPRGARPRRQRAPAPEGQDDGERGDVGEQEQVGGGGGGGARPGRGARGGPRPPTAPRTCGTCDANESAATDASSKNCR
jgi:hypothetical protein